MQKVLLAAVQTPDTSDRQFDMQIEELEELVNTAGGEVVGLVSQKRERFDARTLIGKGKVEELAMHADANEADLIIFYIQVCYMYVYDINRNICHVLHLVNYL